MASIQTGIQAISEFPVLLTGNSSLVGMGYCFQGTRKRHESSKGGGLVSTATCEAILIEVVCDEKGISFLYVITVCVSERIEEANGEAKRSEQCQRRRRRHRTAAANPATSEWSKLRLAQVHLRFNPYERTEVILDKVSS
jgi:hypothetical protein